MIKWGKNDKMGWRFSKIFGFDVPKSEKCKKLKKNLKNGKTSKNIGLTIRKGFITIWHVFEVILPILKKKDEKKMTKWGENCRWPAHCVGGS